MLIVTLVIYKSIEKCVLLCYVIIKAILGGRSSTFDHQKLKKMCIKICYDNMIVIRSPKEFIGFPLKRSSPDI